MTLTTTDTPHLLDKLVTVFDDLRYAKLAVENQKKFQENEPFPHVIFDNFLPADVAAFLAAAYPEPNDPSVNWKTHSNVNVSRKFVEDVGSMSVPMGLFANATTSKHFLLFLETLSGIDCLLADPYFIVEMCSPVTRSTTKK